MSKTHAARIANDSPFCESRRSMKKLEDDLLSPEAMHASLSEIEHKDIAKINLEAMESANPDKIKAELNQAKASLTAVTARLDQLDRQ